MKRNLFVLFAALFAVLMCMSVSAMTLDTAELAEETDVAYEAELAEATAVTPGINLITGTTAFEAFDAEGQTSYPATLKFSGFSTATVSSTLVFSGSNSLECKSGATYPKIYFNVPMEAGRKYHIYAKATASTTNADYIWWVAQDDAKPEQKILHSVSEFKGNATEQKWSVLVGTYTSNSTNPMYFQMKTVSGNIIHYDDLAIVPFYKITYIGLDGETVVATDYALGDASNGFAGTYAPDVSLVEGATGYALTSGGERVAEVSLSGNKDIVIYAIDTPVVGLAYGDEYKNVAVEGDTYTFPVAEETFEGIENFFVYSDGESFYKAGDKVAVSDVIGKTFTAVCTTYKSFDKTYGELALIIDYDLVGVNTVPGHAASSGAVIPSYRNTSIVTSGITHTDGNGVAAAFIKEEGNNKYLKLYTNSYSGHNYWRMNFTAPAAAKYSALEAAKAEDTQGVSDIASLFGAPWHRFIQNGGSDLSTSLSKPTADWTTQCAQKAAKNGLSGSGFSYTRAASDKMPNIYKDNYVLYAYRTYSVYFLENKDSVDFERVDLESTATTYTFPTPKELGIDIENFVAWTNGTKYFKAGEETALANVQYTAFYPFCQSAEEPAMGFTFEGDVKESSVEVSKPVYTKNIVDDGRDVLLVHWFNGYTNASGITTFPTDLRLSFKTNTYSNPAEYNIVQYSAKVANAWDVVTDGTIVKNNDSNKPYWADKTQAPGYTAVASKNSRIFAHTKANGTYTSPVVTVGNPQITVSDSYSIFEYDKSSASDFTTLAGYGFCIDPFQTTYGAYVYMDYLRVYRRGIQTITYATNAPEGATVVTEVAADTNRGLGYGYLLKDVRPEVEGYVFLGWGLTADATETVNSITVDGDETVYAVWAKADTVNTPEVTETVEIKGNGDDDTNGIRFKSAIKPSVKENLDEFGFLATREVLLPYADEEKTTRNYNYLTFNHKVNGADAAYYVQGIAYDADGGIDKENGNNTDGSTVYTAVLSGIPMENKNEKMVVRSYAKYTVNGKEMVVYGNTNAASLYETAAAIKEAGGVAYTNNQAYIDEIVG